METRDDVHIRQMFKEGVEISGFIESHYMYHQTQDTDFTIKLIDVSPDGKSI
jgi:predicted acyl esterase